MGKEQQSLIDAIAKDFNVTRNEAESLLSEWVRYIHQELEASGRVSVEHLGKFTKQNDTISFHPSEELSLEVNYKYAGMESIEILPAYRKSKKQQQEAPGDTETVAGNKQAGTAKKSGEKKSADIESAQTSPSGAAKGTEKKPDTPKRAGEKSGGTRSGAERQTGKARQSIQTKHNVKEKDLSSSSGQAGEKTEKKDWYIVGSLAAVIIIGLFALVYLYEQHFFGGGGAAVVEQTEEPIALADEEEEEEQQRQETVLEEDPVEEAPEPEAGEAGTDRWGLRGDYQAIGDYYTIVVYSLTNRRRAEQEYDQITDEGLRATLNAFNPEPDTQNWRVGIGQFESVEMAEEATDELPKPWRDEYFIIRIR